MVDKKAVTLMEMIVVIVIIGVLATLAFSYNSAARENVFDKEAVSNLKLIRAAEISTSLESNRYYPAAGTDANIPTINQNLGLLLSAGANRAWNYSVKSTGCAQATRNGGDFRTWFLTINDADEEPNAGGVCP